jgi:two-component system chemotaxis response regulator CheY
MSALVSELPSQPDLAIVDKRFLVVDDFDTMRRIISGLLRQLGARSVVEAEDGAHAFEKLLAEPVDFVISDWNMPRMTGLELLKKVRADARLAHLPFLLITAEARKDNILDAVHAGADGYIVKPFSSAVLGDKITNILRRKSAA